MSDTYDVLASDGSVLQYSAEQFERFTEARTRAEHDELIAQGWMALDERIEVGEAPPHRSAVKSAFLETVTPPEPAPHVTVYILGKLRDGEEGVKVV